MASSFEVLAQELERALGSKLVALVEYGSSARTSDGAGSRNTVLICTAVDDGLLADLEEPFARWVRAGHEPPLLFSEREWRSSADVFAIEYEEMLAAHRLLAGRDPFTGIVVRREDVRRQLETELRGKVIRLRQALVAYRNNARALTAAVASSAQGVLTMFRALVRLMGRPAPHDPAELVRDTATLVGFSAGELADIVAHVSGRKKLSLEKRDPRAAVYLSVVVRTADYVDALT